MVASSRRRPGKAYRRRFPTSLSPCPRPVGEAGRTSLLTQRVRSYLVSRLLFCRLLSQLRRLRLAYHGHGNPRRNRYTPMSIARPKGWIDIIPRLHAFDKCNAYKKRKAQAASRSTRRITKLSETGNRSVGLTPVHSNRFAGEMKYKKAAFFVDFLCPIA